MRRPLSQFRLGIDGGGTRCRFALTRPGTRFEHVLGGANAHTDLANAISILTDGLNALAREAGLSKDELRGVPTFAGLAGVMDDTAAKAVETALPLDSVIIEDDRRSAVAGALGGDNGVVASIGTGSFVVRQSNAGLRFLGGYGADLGDEASGCWLGKSLLTRLLHCRDGLKEDSPLVRDTWQRFDGRVDQVLKFAQSASPSEFAQFAPTVVEAAIAGDVNGQDLMQAGAAYIDDCLSALAWPGDEPVCLIGGLGKRYASFLPVRIARCLAEPRGSALDGALYLADTISAQNARAVS
ncbi:ATPase [Rhodobacterales bacterium]|nr:ATPase [Rhodobacterales bacterium]